MNIITNNVSYEVFKKIHRLDTAFKIMTLIKTDYDKEESKDISYYIQKLRALKSRNLNDCMDTLREIERLFKILDDKDYKLGDIGKAKKVYHSLPKEVQTRITFKEELKPDDLIKEAKNIVTSLQILSGYKKTENEAKPSDNEDYMDIDYVATPKKKDNYCYIYEMDGHSTKECRYNIKDKRTKDNGSYKRNDYRRRRRCNKKFNKKYIGNVEMSNEYNKHKNEHLAMDEKEQLITKQIDSIEKIANYENKIVDANKETNKTNETKDINIEETIKNNIDEHKKCNTKETAEQISEENKEYTLELNLLRTNNENLKNDENDKTITWTYDTGCSEHMTHDKSILKDYRNNETNMKCANNTICKFEGVGTFEGTINNYPIKLENVYYSKDINKNLLSGIKLAYNGLTGEIKKNNNKQTQLILSSKNNENSYIIGKFTADNYNIVRIPTKLENKYIYCITNKNKNELNEYSRKLWHQRLGHFYHDDLPKYLRLHNIQEVDCLDCQIAKLKRKPHNGTPPAATRILETIHSDVMGPLSKSITGKRFILTFIDEYSRKAWIYTLKKKSDVPKTVIRFFRYIKNHFDDNIKFFRTDNGKEYKNKKIENYCLNNGIIKTYSPPYNPQNNGKAERFNYTLENCMRALLRTSKLDYRLWEYAAHYANYLYNITPHKGISNSIPNEKFYEKTVDLKYVKTFGCISYYKDFSQNKRKFDPNGKKGVFLGFNFDTNCYMIMDYYDFKIHLVREAVFDEMKPAELKLPNEFNEDSFDNSENINIEDDNLTTKEKTLNNEDFNKNNKEDNINISNNSQIKNINEEIQETKEYAEDEIVSNQDMEEVIEDLDNFNISPENNFKFTPNIKHNHSITGKRRHSFDSSYTINNKKMNVAQYNFNQSTKRKAQIDQEENKNKKTKVENEMTTEEASKNQEISNIAMDIPVTYNQAVTCKFKNKWLEAINNELENLYDNKIMTYVKKLPKNKKPIKTKWVFNIKRDGNNEISKYKARLVAKGFSQVYGTDYDLTFSPTLSIDSLKLILSLASNFHWNVSQLDIKAAYLNADLDKDIYVNIPQGDINYKNGYWKLNKALYGLKQSGRQWNETITEYLKSIGFEQLQSDPCIFKKTNKDNKVTCIIGLYVDDMIITGEDDEIERLIKLIKNKFKISNYGPIDYLLGIKVEKNGYKYSISQVNYINNILSRFNVNNIRKAKTPCTGDNPGENKEPFDKTTYKSALGSLIYLSKCTRPDISYSVNKAARNSENPTVSDWKKVINILKYLNSTKFYKITYDETGEFEAYTDSDLGGNIEDKKSTSGYLIVKGNNPICWQSKKQSTVATSTMEAEYIATTECAKKVLWIKNILKELINYNKPMKIFTDNMASKTTIENGQINSKLKHINLKYYFIKDYVKKNIINLEYISTDKMLADVLTKCVNGPKITNFSNIIFNNSKN